MKEYYLLIIMVLFIGSVNLTVYSANNKTVELTKLSDFSITKINESELKELTYDNYIINVKTSSKSFSLEKIKDNINYFNTKFILFIIFIWLLILIKVYVGYVKNW